jgi:hypothetical protein
MRNTVLLALHLLALSSTGLLAAQPCDQTAIQSAIHQVKSTQSSLLSFKLRDEMDEEVPAPLQNSIGSFKDALAVYAARFLACAPVNSDPKSLQSAMARQLDANKPEPHEEAYDPSKPPQLDHIYGDGITIKISAPANLPNLLFLEFGFGIAYGADSVLLVYQQTENRWTQKLLWQSRNYDEVKDAFGDFFAYVAIPANVPSGWLIAAAHGSPWCTSRWSGFSLDLLEPTASANEPQIRQHIEHGYVRFEIEPVLNAIPGGLQLRLQTGMVDIDVMTRIGPYRYHLDGTKLQRVQPIANNGRDFVDEWLQVPWSDASRWSASAQLDSLKKFHEDFDAQRNSDSSPPTTFGPVRACRDASNHFQVELDRNQADSNGNWHPGPSTYFEIQQGNNSFTMLSASSHANPRCNGPNLMPPQ